MKTQKILIRRKFLQDFFGHGEYLTCTVKNIGSIACGYSSRRTVLHFYKNIKSDSFRKFDYGPRGNLEVYGQVEPPRYMLEEVTLPVATYRGLGDQLTAQKVS